MCCDILGARAYFGADWCLQSDVVTDSRGSGPRDHDSPYDSSYDSPYDSPYDSSYDSPGVLQAREIANATLFYACSESSYCTGGHLMVDGGQASCTVMD